MRERKKEKEEQREKSNGEKEIPRDRLIDGERDKRERWGRGTEGESEWQERLERWRVVGGEGRSREEDVRCGREEGKRETGREERGGPCRHD